MNPRECSDLTVDLILLLLNFVKNVYINAIGNVAKCATLRIKISSIYIQKLYYSIVNDQKSVRSMRYVRSVVSK